MIFSRTHVFAFHDKIVFNQENSSITWVFLVIFLLNFIEVTYTEKLLCLFNQFCFFRCYFQCQMRRKNSLTSSTMKDEIRLTRIIIQYCDTKDQKVLGELKEWFADMNEIQRMCMANSILGRMKRCIMFGAPEEAKNLLSPYRDLYKTIPKNCTRVFG